MKNKKRELSKPAAGVAMAPAPSQPKWPLWTALGAALIAVWWAYSPAMQAPFLFDDPALPFLNPASRERFTFLTALRPMTMFTYWLNLQLSGEDPFGFHALGVLIHLVASGLVFLIARKLFDWARLEASRRTLLAGFAAGVFLLHPAQTEAVAYTAGRAEALSVMFAYAAFAVFLWRREPAVTWGTAAAVLVLFGFGMLSKEHIVVLPAWLLFTDLWWNRESPLKAVRDNWRIYVPIALGAMGGVALVWKLLFSADTAGFGMKEATWYHYLFTQFRAIWVYVGTFLLPVNLTVDWDFPWSRTIMDHGAIFGLVLLVAAIGAALALRRRFPLATYGLLLFLLLMSPTSSILPIRDPVAERRLYFSMIGLLLVAADLLARVKLSQRGLAAVCGAIVLAAAVGTHARAEVWSSPVTLFEDTVRKSPKKVRPRLQLGQAYSDIGDYPHAIATYERLRELQPPDYETLINWGLAYHRQNQLDLALAKFQEAAALEPTAHVYSQIGMIYVQQNRRAEAVAALDQAIQFDPNWASSYNYRAKMHFQANELREAIADYRRALALQPSLADAQAELLRAEAMLRASGGK